MREKFFADCVAGIFFVVLGAVILMEGWRLSALRTRSVVGDDTLPFLVGVAMVGLGSLLIFALKPQKKVGSWPKGRAARSMIETGVVVVGYYIAMPYLGYSLSTMVAGALLFFTVARYRWYLCLAGSAFITLVFYFMFVVWLKIPFEAGIFGI